MAIGSAEIKVEDAKVMVIAELDIVEALRELSKKTDNTIDDALVEMVAAARDGLDWEGMKKEI